MRKNERDSYSAVQLNNVLPLHCKYICKFWMRARYNERMFVIIICQQQLKRNLFNMNNWKGTRTKLFNSNRSFYKWIVMTTLFVLLDNLK